MSINCVGAIKKVRILPTLGICRGSCLSTDSISVYRIYHLRTAFSLALLDYVYNVAQPIVGMSRRDQTRAF